MLIANISKLCNADADAKRTNQLWRSLAASPLPAVPTSLKIGLCNFAPHSLDSRKRLQQVEDRRLIFQQENGGEDKTKIATKSHDLDCSGWMTSASDLHRTISNLWKKPASQNCGNW
jgi:hypothetical protein